MSQDNVELVQRAFDAFSVGGVEAALPFYSRDVVMYSVPEWPEDPLYRGHDGARKLTGAWTDNFDEWGWEVHELRDVGTGVVALVEMTGGIKDSGVPIRQPVGIVCSDFRDGTVGEFRFFLTWQAALEAVGLAE